MALKNLPFASLTQRELQKIKEAESFLNDQPDHQKDRQEGKEIILLAYMYKNGE